MKSILLLMFLIAGSCSAQSKIKSIEFVPKQFKVITTGNDSPEKSDLLIVCYNKYFNQDRYSPSFVSKNHLDSIDYKKNMAIEIFLGEKKEGHNLNIEKIEENKDSLKIYYTFEIMKSIDSDILVSPYIIVETPKSRKPFIFFENGEKFQGPNFKLYINN